MERKTLKQYVYTFLVFILALSMCACGNIPAGNPNPTDNPSIEEPKSEENMEKNESSKDGLYPAESTSDTTESPTDESTEESKTEEAIDSSNESSEKVPEESTFENVIIDENGEKVYQFEEGTASDIKFINESPDEERALNVIEKLNRCLICYRNLTFNPDFYDIRMQYDTEHIFEDDAICNNENFTTKNGTPFTVYQTICDMPYYYYYQFVNVNPIYKSVYDTFSNMSDKDMQKIGESYGIDLDFPLCVFVCEFSAYLNKCNKITIKEINTIYKEIDGEYDVSMMDETIFGKNTKISYQVILLCDDKEELEGFFDKDGNLIYLYYRDDTKDFEPITTLE